MFTDKPVILGTMENAMPDLSHLTCVNLNTPVGGYKTKQIVVPVLE